MGEMTGIENHCLIEFFLYFFFCTNLLQCISLRVSECTVQNVQSVTQSVWNICNAVNMHCEKGVSVVWIRDMYWWKDLVTLELVLLLPCLKCMRHPFVVLGLLVDAQEITDSHINSWCSGKLVAPSSAGPGFKSRGWRITVWVDFGRGEKRFWEIPARVLGLMWIFIFIFFPSKNSQVSPH